MSFLVCRKKRRIKGRDLYYEHLMLNERITKNSRTQKIIWIPSLHFRVKSAISMSSVVGDCVRCFWRPLVMEDPQLSWTWYSRIFFILLVLLVAHQHLVCCCSSSIVFMTTMNTKTIDTFLLCFWLLHNWSLFWFVSSPPSASTLFSLA